MASNAKVRTRYSDLASRIRRLGFAVQVTRPNGLVGIRYSADGFLAQELQVGELGSDMERPLFVSAAVSVLDRIDAEQIRHLSNDEIPRYQVRIRWFDRYGNSSNLDDGIDKFQGWALDEWDAIYKVIEDPVTRWLERLSDTRQIIGYLKGDVERIETDRAAWERQVSRKHSWIKRLFDHRTDPFNRPGPVPPGHILAIANLCLRLGALEDAARYIEQVCAIWPGWKGHRRALDALRVKIGQPT